MRTEVIRRPRVARPRRDTIAVTIPRSSLWMAAAGVVVFGAVTFIAGWWIGRSGAGEVVPASTRVMLVKPEVPAAPPAAAPAPPPAPPPRALPLAAAPPAPPPDPPPPKVELDIRERGKRGRHGIQIGAFPDRGEAIDFLERHAEELSSFPIYVLPAKVGRKGVWYRVRVGSFSGKDDAEVARRALPEDLAKGSMVVRYH